MVQGRALKIYAWSYELRKGLEEGLGNCRNKVRISSEIPRPKIFLQIAKKLEKLQGRKQVKDGQ
jgi:hypothetical protein